MSDVRVDKLLDHVTELYRQIEGLKARDEQPNNAKKLSKAEVDRIRSKHRLGMSQRQLADMYDVNPATISRIVRGIYHK